MTKKPSQGRKAGKSIPGTTDKRTLIAVSIVVILTAIVFYPSLQNGFTNWDDNQYVTQNEIIKDLSLHGLKTFFTTFYGGNYHPLVALTNAIEYHFWQQLNATPYHLINLLLHLANTGLVFWFIILLTRRLEAAFIVALLFGIHPMHVESVAWIAERKDVLYTSFFLGSLICYVLYSVKEFKPKYLTMSFVLLLLALFSKSAAVVAPLVMLLIDYYRKRQWTWKVILEKAPFLLLSLTFGIVALFSQGSAKALNTLAPFSFLDRVCITSYAIVFYVIKLMLPIRLSAFYNFPLLGGPLPLEYYVAPFVILIVLLVVFKSKNFRPALVFGFSFYLVNIVLVVQIVSIGMTVVSERYAYVSSIGLFLVVALLYCHLVDRKKGSWIVLTRTALAGFALLCAVQTWERCKVWDNGITLFTDALEKERTSPIPYYNRAMAKYHTNDFAGAIADFNSAIALYAKEPDYFLNRGASKFAVGDYAGARDDFRALLALKPDHAEGLVNYGNALAMLGNYQDALVCFDKSIALDPTEKMSYFNRGHLHLRLNDTTKACEDWRKALELGYTDAAYMLNKHCKK